MPCQGEPPSSTAVILAFPGQALKPSDAAWRISPTERDELARWEKVSGRYGWQIGGRDGPSIETGRDGRQYVRIMLRPVSDDLVYFVAPEMTRGGRGWTVLDRRGVAKSWSTLRDALESICPTVWQFGLSHLSAAPAKPGVPGRQPS